MFMGMGASDRFLDLCTNEFYPVEGTTGKWSREKSPKGAYYLSDPSSSSLYARINLGQPSGLEFSGSDEFTILIGFVRTANQPAGWGRLVCRTNGTTGDDWGLILADDAGGGHARFRINGNNLDGTTDFVNGQYYEIAATYKQGDRKLIIDGVVEVSDSYSGTLQNDQNIWIGGNPGSNGDRVAEAGIYHCTILDRALEVDEVIEYQRNSAQILAPEIVYLPVDEPSGATNLIIQDSNHAMTSDNLTLTQDHQLVVNDSIHSMTSDNVALTQLHIITVQDSSHGLSSDNVDLTQLHILSIDDAFHGLSSENIALTQDHQLSIDDSLHSHTADNVVINIADTLIIADSAHAVTSDTVNLTQDHQLVIQDALHAHTSDNLDLTQDHVLVIDDSLHAMLSDLVTLTIPSDSPTPENRVFVIESENRVYVVASENRTFVIDEENRTYPIH